MMEIDFILICCSQAGGDNKIKTSPVTGYAVFADGKRVTDVDSPESK